jgi:VIT1/CCC1 family predicted Fe2+/Mn2+ transporter
MAQDPLAAHARDELGLTEETAARPLQAAFASAASFAIGAAAPLIIILTVPRNAIVLSAAGTSLIVLAILGGAGAKAGGAPVMAAVVRVTVWGALAMAVTAGIGHLFGTVIS